MEYDEDLLVELIACGEVSQTEIAERVGVSRRTVWRIANGHSRPDLQQKIADTVEGYRQETIRMATRWLRPLLAKQIKVALEDDGETSRKAREFLIKTFVGVAVAKPAKTAGKSPQRTAGGDLSPQYSPFERSLTELPPDLKHQVLKELGGPAEDSAGIGVYEGKEEASDQSSVIGDQLTANAGAGAGEDIGPAPEDDFRDDPASDREGKKVADPFANFVDGPFGKKVNAISLEILRESQDESPPKRRSP